MKNCFSAKVYEAIKLIPVGKVTTYGEIARFIGQPNACRAVGNALHKNPLPIVQPCHRVVNAKGELSKNFGLGANKQSELLKKEHIVVKNNMVDLKKYMYKFNNI